MTYLPFEKYLLEQGFTPDGEHKEFNTMYCPTHCFIRGNEIISISLRIKYHNPKDFTEKREVTFSVMSRRGDYIMPTDEKQFPLLLEGKLKTVWEVFEWV